MLFFLSLCGMLVLGYNGVQETIADNTEPTCYSRFDYDMRMFETVADTKHNQKLMMDTVNKLQDLVEKLGTKVDVQEQTMTKLTVSQKALTDTVKKLQDVVETLGTNVGVQEQTIMKLANNVKSQHKAIQKQEQQIENQAVAIATYTSPIAKSTEGGSAYVRWGRTSCPTNGTAIIYKGYVGGSIHSDQGSGADHQCLPEDPTWGKYQDGTQGAKAYMYGAEYEPGSLHFDSLRDQDAPCAVCLTTRSSVIMIPARTSCYPGWTLEYEGNLASSHYSQQRSQYTCMDKEAEAAPLTDPSNNNGALFYAVEGRCGSLPCPPYVEGRELACVVCSK